MRKKERDDRKLRELILYVATRTVDDPNAGAVKLNKILYHAETRAFLELGAPISGHPYVALDFGPAPKDLRPIRKNLELSGDAEVIQEPAGPYAQERVVALRQADQSIFTWEELAVVDRVIAELRPLSQSALSADSHQLPGWRAAYHRKKGAVIPYEAAFISNKVTPADLKRGRELAVTEGWA